MRTVVYLHSPTVRCLQSSSAASFSAIDGVVETQASFCSASFTCTRSKAYTDYHAPILVFQKAHHPIITPTK